MAIRMLRTCITCAWTRKAIWRWRRCWKGGDGDAPDATLFILGTSDSFGPQVGTLQATRAAYNRIAASSATP